MTWLHGLRWSQAAFAPRSVLDSTRAFWGVETGTHLFIDSSCVPISARVSEAMPTWRNHSPLPGRGFG